MTSYLYRDFTGATPVVGVLVQHKIVETTPNDPNKYAGVG